MKAREIKKLINEEYRSRIKEHKSVVAENETRVLRVKAHIEELEFIREMLFDVEETYNVDKGIIEKDEPEVDDVPF